MKRLIFGIALVVMVGLGGCATMQAILDIITYEPTVTCFQLAPTKGGAYYCDGIQCQFGTESCISVDTNCSCTEAP